jgi:hypothetical protein
MQMASLPNVWSCDPLDAPVAGTYSHILYTDISSRLCAFWHDVQDGLSWRMKLYSLGVYTDMVSHLYAVCRANININGFYNDTK